MKTPKSPRRRSAKSARLSKYTRAAYEEGRGLLDRIGGDPALGPLREDPEGQQLMEQLRQDLAILGVAPTLRIGAARRLQGASSRRRTASHALFDACAEIRRRVKLRYRGPRHAELRRVFGEGLPASPAKPETVLAFAALILSSARADDAPGNMAALYDVRVGPPTLQRVRNLLGALRACGPERSELRSQRRRVAENLQEIAARVNETAAALEALAARLCPSQDSPAAQKPPAERRAA